MIKDSETFIYIIPFHNEFGITFIWNVFLHCDLHKFSELKIFIRFKAFKNWMWRWHCVKSEKCAWLQEKQMGVLFWQDDETIVA